MRIILPHRWTGGRAGRERRLLPRRCAGWATDRFGVSWQVVPQPMTEPLASRETEAPQRVRAAMTTRMGTIDIITALEDAAAA